MSSPKEILNSPVDEWSLPPVVPKEVASKGGDKKVSAETFLVSILKTKMDTSVMQVQERLLIAILETINTSKTALGMAKTHQVATITALKTEIAWPYCLKCEDILIFPGEGGGCFQPSGTDLPSPLA